jgi:hypothetical protein
VEAVELLQKHLGHRMQNEPSAPLLRMANGSPLTREHIQALLERAAVACDLPPDRFRSHSLRIGGATALYHVYHDVDIIKRYGRWASGAFQGYLWEANETAKGVAQRMATDNTTLHLGNPAEGFARETHRDQVPGGNPATTSQRGPGRPRKLIPSDSRNFPVEPSPRVSATHM